MNEPAPSNEVYLDTIGVSTAELVRHLQEVLGKLAEGRAAPRFRLWATVLILLRQELRRRGDSDDGGAVQALRGVPTDVLAEANKVLDEGIDSSSA
jgi:hypothetical protein